MWRRMIVRRWGSHCELPFETMRYFELVHVMNRKSARIGCWFFAYVKTLKNVVFVWIPFCNYFNRDMDGTPGLSKRRIQIPHLSVETAS